MNINCRRRSNRCVRIPCPAGLGFAAIRLPALNILNTRYIIGSNPSAVSNQQPFYITNPNALGPCWFVREVRFAPTLQDEMKSLSGLNAAEVAIVPEDQKRTSPARG